MDQESKLKIIFIAGIQDEMHRGCVRLGQAPLQDGTSVNTPPNAPALLAAAANKADAKTRGTGIRHVIHHAEIGIAFKKGNARKVTAAQVAALLMRSGIRPHDFPGGDTRHDWYDCSPKTAENAILAAKNGLRQLDARDIIRDITEVQEPAKRPEKAKGKKARKVQQKRAADALKWDDAMRLIASLQEDGRYREAMIAAIGCYMGLRISDTLQLRWKDLLPKDHLELVEIKTGKKRTIRINPALAAITRACHEDLCIEDDGEYIARSPQYGGNRPITRQRVNQLTHEMKRRYLPDKEIAFSSHTFRKTFGRRVYQNECKHNRGETALMLLADVFGHSNTNITKRYLGIRKEEILSVYDIL